MRKVLGWITGVLLLGIFPLPLVHAQEPGVDASVSQWAYATNIVKKGGDNYMYLAGAERVTHVAGQTRTKAFAERAKCLTLETKRITLIACAAFVFPKRIADEAFEFDPLLESASVKFEGKGGRTAMRWTGRGMHEPDASPYADVSYAGVYADVYRSAVAEGEILGERYPKGPMGFALLSQGAMAEGYAGDGVEITPLGNGGYEVTALFRVPRHPR